MPVLDYLDETYLKKFLDFSYPIEQCESTYEIIFTVDYTIFGINIPNHIEHEIKLWTKYNQ